MNPNNILYSNHGLTFCYDSYRPIQFILTSYTYPYEITNSFDMNYLGSYYDGNNVYVNLEFIISLQYKTVDISYNKILIKRLKKVIMYNDYIVNQNTIISLLDQIFKYINDNNRSLYYESIYDNININMNKDTSEEMLIKLKFHMKDISTKNQLFNYIDNFDSCYHNLSNTFKNNEDDLIDIIFNLEQYSRKTPLQQYIKSCSMQPITLDSNDPKSIKQVGFKFISELNFKPGKYVNYLGDIHSKINLSQPIVLKLNNVKFKTNPDYPHSFWIFIPLGNDYIENSYKCHNSHIEPIFCNLDTIMKHKLHTYNYNIKYDKLIKYYGNHFDFEIDLRDLINEINLPHRFLGNVELEFSGLIFETSTYTKWTYVIRKLNIIKELDPYHPDPENIMNRYF